MKRVLTLLLVFLLATVQAGAQSRTVVNEAGELEWMDFDEKLPSEAEPGFSALLHEGDKILCGAMKASYNRQDWILAVEREAHVLLMGAVRLKGEWTAAIETDSFLPLGTAFDITLLPRYSDGTKITDELSLICGEETYRLALDNRGAISITDYHRQETDGSRFVISIFPQGIGCYRYANGTREVLYEERGVFPKRLTAWSIDMFPTSAEVIRQFHAAHAVQLAADEAFISGGNFREEPTSAAKSWGQYSAKVKVLGSTMGAREPWYNVQLGHLTGWVSGNYVLTERDDPQEIYSAVSWVNAVARADGDIQLWSLPDGETIQTIPAGTLMHVLMDRDGWMHVIIPRGELSWETDWAGTYGFVRAGEVTKGVSIADVTWR